MDDRPAIVVRVNGKSVSYDNSTNGLTPDNEVRQLTKQMRVSGASRTVKSRLEPLSWVLGTLTRTAAEFYNECDAASLNQLTAVRRDANTIMATCGNVTALSSMENATACLMLESISLKLSTIAVENNEQAASAYHLMETMRVALAWEGRRLLWFAYYAQHVGVAAMVYACNANDEKMYAIAKTLCMATRCHASVDQLEL